MVIGEAIGTTDVAIIGAGPGGYTAAIRLAELGQKVTLIDRESVGGVCLHHGCIPAKALIHAADLYQNMNEAKSIGVSFDNLSIDFNKTQDWKRKIVEDLDNGIRSLLNHHKVQLIQANAFFEESNKLALRPLNEDEHLDINALEFKKCIVAIGSQVRHIPGVEIDGDKIITSREILEIDQLPESLLIIGGGYIGIEISQMLSKLGVKVTVVESLPSILNLLDPEFSELVRKKIQGLGGTVYENSKVQSSTVEGDKVKTVLEGGQEIWTDKVLVSVGRVPNTKDIQLENTKVELDEHGYIKVDSQMKTADPRIFAIGDVVGRIMLAHKASAEAKVAADVIVGNKNEFDYFIPYAIFSDPEISGVGITEKEAKEQGVTYETKVFKYSSLGKAHILNGKTGFMKMLYNGDEILGVHIAGPRASDLVGEATLAMELGATPEDIALTIHPHPTVVESFMEIADQVLGLPINTL